MPDETTRLLSGNTNHNAHPVEIRQSRGFSRSGRRTSIVSGSVGRPGFANIFADSQPAVVDNDYIVTASEARDLAREQQELLGENHIAYMGRRASNDARRPDEVTDEILDTTAAWDDAVDRGKIHTTIGLELKVLSVSASPLVVTFCLQYSLTVASIFAVGHLGKTYLAAVSLATMTATMTAFSLIQGLATCLDTLCPQAYGAGNYKLVGLYLQKCVVLCLLLFVPIAAMWWRADDLLNLVVPNQPETTALARQYLRLLLPGMPGFILFECGKRYVQAQGNFHASTLVLLVCSPINILLNYVLVWDARFGIGFGGAAISISITYWLMPILLLIYIFLAVGGKCWNGLTMDAFRSWESLVRLGVPGIIMVEAEFMAFEVLTIAASHFGTGTLAAQSALSTLTSLTYQVPFAISIAAATRVANFIGATLPRNAEVAAKTALTAAASVSVCLGIILFLFRRNVGALFSSDPEVIDLVAKVLPYCAFMQLFDATGGVAGGVLRGQGRQKIGGYLNLFFYYPVALPLCMFLAFTLDWELAGLWIGVTFGLACICACQTYFILTSDWHAIVDAARKLVRDERIVE